MSLILLKSAVAEYQFPNPKEEILFFKTWKPQISGLLMFYVRLYQIEKKRIGESPSSQCKYLKSELENLKNTSWIILSMIITVPAGRNSTNNICQKKLWYSGRHPFRVAGQGFFFHYPAWFKCGWNHSQQSFSGIPVCSNRDIIRGTSFEIHFNGRKPAIAVDGQQGRFGWVYLCPVCGQMLQQWKYQFKRHSLLLRDSFQYWDWRLLSHIPGNQKPEEESDAVSW